ncbi:MAG: hypothetical protein IJC50_00320, partial [Clostridia bacterium]|nr:hypothetical protein [Clostridia bacterium]
MKNFKRILAAVLMVAMLLPMCVVSVNAGDEGQMLNDWKLFGGRFTKSQGMYGYAKRDQGFTMTENDDGSITVHSASKSEYGDKLGSSTGNVAYITNQNMTMLDNLSVTVKPGANFSFTDSTSSLGVMFTAGHPLTIEEIFAAGSQAALDNLPYGNVGSGDLTQGLRGYILDRVVDEFGNVTLQGETGIYVKISGTDSANKDPLIANGAYIYLFDGEFADKSDDRYGYRWSYTARNFMPHTPNGGFEDVTSFFEFIDTNHGVTFEFIPDDILGYKVYINGKDFSKGIGIGYFPNNTNGSISRDMDYVADVLGMTENYITSMSYLRDDIDLSYLYDNVIDGYLTVGTTGPATTTGYDFEVVSVNGVPAAQWYGEYAEEDHVHEYEIISETPATCTMQSRTISQCYCGAIHQNQYQTYLIGDINREIQKDLKDELDAYVEKNDIDSDTYYKAIQRLNIEKYWESTDALGHDYVATVTEATCFEDGLTTYTCSRCEDSYTMPILKKGHDVTSWTEENGVLTRSCKTCGEVETKTVAASAAAEDYWTVAHRSLLSHVGVTSTDGDGKAVSVD